MSNLMEERALTKEKLEKIESEISENQRKNDFNVTDYAIESIVEKFTKNLEQIDKAELFIPDYQREYIWDDKKASQFIESIILDLPIPYIYVASINGGEDDGRLEIVDGSQRIRTLVKFLRNKLELTDLPILKSLNGLRFRDLPFGRQLKIKRKNIRWVELVDISEEDRRELFRRINTGGVKLQPMEVRRGSQDGDFLKFVRELADNALFKELCPVSKTKEKIRQRDEMVVRFFAYRLDFENYKGKVQSFIDGFVKKVNDGEIVFDKNEFNNLFINMLNFVRNNFSPLYFKKSENNSDVSRIRFEAISVGVSFALKEAEESGNKITCDNCDWLYGNTFMTLTRSDASNSRPKLIDRTYYICNKLLNKDWQAQSTSYSLGEISDDW